MLSLPTLCAMATTWIFSGTTSETRVLTWFISILPSRATGLPMLVIDSTTEESLDSRSRSLQADEGSLLDRQQGSANVALRRGRSVVSTLAIDRRWTTKLPKHSGCAFYLFIRAHRT